MVMSPSTFLHLLTMSLQPTVTHARDTEGVYQFMKDANGRPDWI